MSEEKEKVFIQKKKLIDTQYESNIYTVIEELSHQIRKYS